MKTNFITNRPFGIELEATHARGTYIARDLAAAGVNVQYAGYTHATTSYWKVVTDGSLGHGGFELVSPILRGEAGLAEARNAAKQARTLGAVAKRSCGFHVHVDVSDLDLPALKRLCQMFVKYEQVFDHVVPNSRRDNVNIYCASNVRLFASVEAAFAKIAAANTVAELKQVMNRGSRYYKLNLQNLGTSRTTVEFRQHAGTVDADKVENWVRLLVAFVEEAKFAKLIRKPEAVNREVVRKLESMITGKFLGGQRLRPFFKKRIAELNAPSQGYRP